jgi:hypothetical protein
MNWRLFASRHFFVAALLVAGFIAWSELAEITPGRAKGSEVDFLLWSGWAALGLYVAVVLYAWRKYAHKGRYSPEFRWAVPVETVERAKTRLSVLGVRIRAREVVRRGLILREVRRILRQEGVRKVLRVRLKRGPKGGPRFVLNVDWREPLGRVSRWMHVHIFYGLAAAALVWLHGGGNFTSPMGIALNGLSYLVIATGLGGILLWAFGPSWLSRCERDVSIEKAFALRDHYGRKVREARTEVQKALAEAQPAAGGGAPAADPGQLGRKLAALEATGAGFATKATALLADLPASMSPKSRGLVRDLVVLLGQRRNLDAEWQALARVRWFLNVWRLVHVPASILLLVVVAVHVVSVWWY